MEISAQNEKENILIARLRNIREMQAELFLYFACPMIYVIYIAFVEIKSTQVRLHSQN